MRNAVLTNYQVINFPGYLWFKVSIHGQSRTQAWFKWLVIRVLKIIGCWFQGKGLDQLFSISTNYSSVPLSWHPWSLLEHTFLKSWDVCGVFDIAASLQTSAFSAPTSHSLLTLYSISYPSSQVLLLYHRRCYWTLAKVCALCSKSIPPFMG